jgi:photosystem II stability/assembly factor-like uncharacterized protein
MGTTGGGVFKTSDGGLTWRPTSDAFFGGTIGAIAVSETNADIVYVGTGEYPIRGNVSHGDGVYRSSDGGRTWTYIGLAETRQISRVRIHPKNPDVVYVGAQGHTFAPNPERGVYRTTDGGKNWKKILFRNDSTGVTDLAMDPADPKVLYAAFWQAGRKPWMLSSGGAGSGIFKTTDGGDNWKEITRNPGMPKGIIGNIGITVSAAMPARVWAIIENDSGGVYRSDDAGATWTRMNWERKLRQRAWYYSRIFADPKDSNTVYVLNTSIWRSRDGGRTFSRVRDPHGDNHDLWIAADNPQRMINSNDGGANVSTNGGQSWTAQSFATAQFYHVSTTTDFPYWVCGAQQDNTSLCGPSANPGGIHYGDWKNGGGCESGYVVSRPDQPNIVFAGCYGGFISRTDLRTGFQKDVSPWPVNPLGHPSSDIQYRMQWTTPIAISPHDPNVLYVGANVLFKSTDEGMSWKAISPDLTRHDPATLGPSGGPITKDQTGVETYGTIFTIAESPKEKGTIWTGSDDGYIQITRDGGGKWTNVTPKDLGDFTRISLIEASPHAAGTAYVAANRYQLDDMRPYIFATYDYGKTWKRLDAGIGANEFVRVVREDPVRKGMLYAGTERGVWVSFDDGGHWQRLQRNLPPVPVHDLVIKDNDLVIATHGRSFWIMDDIATLRLLAPEVLTGPSHLFSPAPVVSANFGGAGPEQGLPGGQNPPFGAIIDYWVKNADQKVTLEFSDADGKLIKSFTSVADTFAFTDSLRYRAKLDSLRNIGVLAASVDTNVIRRVQPEAEEAPAHPFPPDRAPNKKGMNRFVWDLQYPDAAWFSRMVLWTGFLQGPVAVPGTYTVKLTVAGASESQNFTIKNDPRSTAKQADLEEQFKLMIQIRDAVSAANNGVRTSRNVKAQMAAAIAKTNDATLSAKLNAVEAELYSVQNRAGQDMLNYPIKLNDQLGSLYNSVASADGKPTAQEYEVFKDLNAQLQKQVAALNQALGADLTAVNNELSRLKQPAIVPGTADLSM